MVIAFLMNKYNFKYIIYFIHLFIILFLILRLFLNPYLLLKKLRVVDLFIK